jgi:hypothetical protein
VSIINSRAKLPAESSSFGKKFNVNYRTIFSVNPKTEKSELQTYILHLAPHDLSGHNVCPGAGNCKAICLHFAGNPIYMGGKHTARIRRTLAYVDHRENFVKLLIMGILHKQNLHKGDNLAIRLNGTSDIEFEKINVTIDEEFYNFCVVKFGRYLPLGKRNIFEIFNDIAAWHGGDTVEFYDYTKIRRDWAECKRLGYHLTFSYDGMGNHANHKLAADAIKVGVNVAAAFNIKKSGKLPEFAWLGAQKFPVVNGDLTDYRPADPMGCIVGLRFKLPHGIDYTDAEKEAFCMG